MTKDYIYKLFELFTKGTTKQRFVWTPSEKSSTTIDKWLLVWKRRGIREESIGLVFLYDYFCDTYNYWSTNEARPNILPFEWVMSQKQIERWDNRHEEYQYLYQEQFLSKNKIPTLSEIKKLFREKAEVQFLPEVHEETERGRFFNTDRGYVNCLLSTTLVHPESRWCQKCNFRSECEGQLKTTNPKLALKRKYIKL